MKIATPPELIGSPEIQLLTMRRYLYMLSKDLEAALSNLTIDNFTEQTARRIGAMGEEKTAEQYDTVRSMIIKNADFVRAEIDRIETVLSSTYVAQSDFGTYKESVDTAISLQADALRLELARKTELEATNQSIEDLQSYTEELSGYIQVGLISEPGETETEIGIAMGKDIQKNVDGVITRSGFYTTYTTQGLTFWDGDVKVFWIASDTLHAGEVQIDGSLKQGPWQIDTSGGWTLRWIGG